ncbi:hypothetical protein UFOVP176_62 [uncultured Caudovirales phage]|uniref:dATP/dGTP diphosphohydrolase N-terminal domain-containing protein n=1 Tax=uncultured Caudovirales phage TaxID=2100421 RepID=A0A6J7WJF5_9CAUD|nr:hypothetical protein UFOVP176_62 [uncultured Caudovirales phage]
MVTVKEIEQWIALGQPAESIDTLTKQGKINTKGLKYDSGKLNWSLMPFGALQEVVKVLEFGSKKYAPNNWQYVDNADERYWNAAMRHLIAYKTESTNDSETGLSHLAHAICCMLFLQHLNNENNAK